MKRAKNQTQLNNGLQTLRCMIGITATDKQVMKYLECGIAKAREISRGSYDKYLTRPSRLALEEMLKDNGVTIL